MAKSNDMKREMIELKVSRVLLNRELTDEQRLDLILDIVFPKINCSTCQYANESKHCPSCISCDNYSNHKL